MKYEYGLKNGSILTMALSNKQSKRLGAIISVVFEEHLPNNVDKDLVTNGFVETTKQAIGYEYKLTDKGLDEKNRLCTLAGLNIRYQSEKNNAKETKKTEETIKAKKEEAVIGASEI